MNTNTKHLTQGTRIFDVVYETVELNTEIYIFPRQYLVSLFGNKSPIELYFIA